MSNPVAMTQEALKNPVQTTSMQAASEKISNNFPEHQEDIAPVYDNAEEEPELHVRTWMALLAIWVLNYAQVVALIAPTAVLNYIGRSLDGTKEQAWVPNALSLVAGVLGPILSSASDIFRARKPMLLMACVFGFVGSAIAPGSKNIYRLIVAQIIIGFGYASVPLGYSVPSEILPRKWRPLAQSWINVAAGLASISGPLMIGALTKKNPENGWRNLYWFQMALWASAGVALFFGYQPPKRRTVLDSLSFLQKIRSLDLTGSAILAVGLTLLLTGLNLGGGLYSWTNARTLSTLIIGIVTCILFGIYEWKGTKTGIIHHDLFSLGNSYARTFAICCALFAVEAALIFAFTIFYPILTEALYESDPFLSVARAMPYWVGAVIANPCWAYVSSRFRTIRTPMLLGFLIYTAGTIGFTTLQPGQSFNALAFAAISGIGFGAPLVMIIAGVQLSTPHSLIATATAVAVSSRGIFATVFTAIYSAVLNNKLPAKIASYVPVAVISVGLPPTSVPAFIQALTDQDLVTLQTIPGVTPAIIQHGVTALKQAFADSIRPIFIIASAFSAVATFSVLLINDMRDGMNYRVEAPLEDLHARKQANHVEHEG